MRDAGISQQDRKVIEAVNRVEDRMKSAIEDACDYARQRLLGGGDVSEAEVAELVSARVQGVV